MFSIPHEIFKRIEVEGGDVFSLYSKVAGKKIILEKIDEKQLLDRHHHQAEGELIDLRIAGAS